MSACRAASLVRQLRRAAACAAVGVCALSAVAARADIEFDPTWQPPTYEAVREAVDAWVDEVQPENSVVDEIEAIWADDQSPDALGADNIDLLDRVAASLAAADARAAELVAICRADYQGPALPNASWLSEENVPTFERVNLRLYYARWLAQFGLYDEVLAELDGLEPDDVVDPASLLFYRMVAYQQLVQPDEARAALVQLLEQRDRLPRRYQQVAQLLEVDLESISDESLDHIARRMSDIRRRLAYGRAGAHVQEIERGVVESLDQKIKKLEEQARQQQSMMQPGGGSQQAQPMQDSQLAPMNAPMQVDQKDIGNKSGWGDLPPRERELALQQLGRDFPAHYRDLIEQYFRELAAEPASPDE